MDNSTKIFKMCKDSSSLDLAFINLYIRNTIPNLNEKNIKKCHELLSNHFNRNNQSTKLFTILKPFFINYEALNLTKLINLLSFLYNNAVKQMEIFQNNSFNIQV